ncbi:hypothetical protein [Candidatus Filomicrobium marinum]|uniref:hypothetical protein n=1 Tax=Candidatus Filomicrobium marinum TaxID=1608628 RepID=UPI001364D54E|nr:hypothetical protein [Candidatus Filomicrobium marinum]
MTERARGVFGKDHRHVMQVAGFRSNLRLSGILQNKRNTNPAQADKRNAEQ